METPWLIKPINYFEDKLFLSMESTASRRRNSKGKSKATCKIDDRAFMCYLIFISKSLAIGCYVILSLICFLIFWSISAWSLDLFNQNINTHAPELFRDIFFLKKMSPKKTRKKRTLQSVPKNWISREYSNDRTKFTSEGKILTTKHEMQFREFEV
jgi:hypothetical protein